MVPKFSKTISIQASVTCSSAWWVAISLDEKFATSPTRTCQVWTSSTCDLCFNSKGKIAPPARHWHSKACFAIQFEVLNAINSNKMFQSWEFWCLHIFVGIWTLGLWSDSLSWCLVLSRDVTSHVVKGFWLLKCWEPSRRSAKARGNASGPLGSLEVSKITWKKTTETAKHKDPWQVDRLDMKWANSMVKSGIDLFETRNDLADLDKPQGCTLTPALEHNEHLNTKTGKRPSARRN